MHGTFRSSRILVQVISVIALVLIASTAFAQGFYYKEIARDGRIFVFNVAANAARFEQTGEMGIGITKPGTGPNGETVVGDNERALQLFYFKHGLSVVVPDPVAPVQLIVWRDGKTRITTDLAYLEMSNRVQVRFTDVFPDDAVTLAGTSGPGKQMASWRIRRAKFKLEGWFLQPWLTYETQLNYPGVTTAGNPGAILEDAAFDIDFSKGRGLYRLHVGQFKPPYGAQEMTSSGNQTFTNRALVSNSFFRGRDIGAAFWGATANNKLEWRVGAFNGNGVTQILNNNDKMQYDTARLMWQPNGSQVLNQRAWVTGALYSEGDFESTTAPIYALAINLENQNNFNATAGTTDQKWMAYSVDGIYKFKGFTANGMYTLAQRKVESGAKFDAPGGFIQLGKLFSRRRYEVAVRYGQFDPTDQTAHNTTKEIRGAFSYYYARHGLKWQNDFGQTEVQNGTAATVKTMELRSQLQFIF